MPALIHAKLGAYLAENEYGIKDREVLDAITYHTTGRPEMTMLEKILYIADYIEPNRREIPGLSKFDNSISKYRSGNLFVFRTNYTLSGR